MAETFSSRVRLRMTLALPLMKSKLYVEGARVVGIGHRCGVIAGVDRGAPLRIFEQGSSLVPAEYLRWKILASAHSRFFPVLNLANFQFI
jgi:hypothetical protein